MAGNAPARQREEALRPYFDRLIELCDPDVAPVAGGPELEAWESEVIRRVLGNREAPGWARLVVDAAGLDADRVAALAGLDPDALGWRQHPCKGDYFALGPGVRLSLSHLISPVPQQAGLPFGQVQVIPHVHLQAKKGGEDPRPGNPNHAPDLQGSQACSMK